jgi:hypothetical protein
MSFDGIDKRKTARRIYSDNIEFSLSPPPAQKIMVGSCVNISEFGMCIYTFDHLDEGEIIEIKDTLPVPFKRATVRWVKAYSGNFYKVGLTFID